MSPELVVPKKACACMMESFLSSIGHNKSRSVELARNSDTAKFHGFKLEIVSVKARLVRAFCFKKLSL